MHGAPGGAVEVQVKVLDFGEGEGGEEAEVAEVKGVAAQNADTEGVEEGKIDRWARAPLERGWRVSLFVENVETKGAEAGCESKEVVDDGDVLDEVRRLDCE